MRKRPSEDWKEYLLRSATRTAEGCLLYSKALTWGYGTVTYRGATHRAHRIMYMLTFPKQDISSLQINHHCDNRACINPDHLYAGTQEQNVADMMRRKRGNFDPIRGSKNHFSKLSDADIPVIRSRLFAGETAYSVAKDYSVDARVISRIGKREKWSHIP